MEPGARNYWKSHDFAELSDDLIAIMVDAAATLPTDECEVFTAQLGGTAGQIDGTAMAYAHRSNSYTMNIHGRWLSPDEDHRCRAWVRSLFDRSTPLSEGSVYINFVPEPGEARTKGAFGANLPRLKDIKARFDPLNLFRANVQIGREGGP